VASCPVALSNTGCKLIKFRWYKKWYKNPVETAWISRNYLYIRGIESLTGGGSVPVTFGQYRSLQYINYI